MLFASHFLRDSCCSEFKGETWAVGIVRSVLPLRPRRPLAPHTCLHLRLLWHLLLSRILALVPLLPRLSLTSAGGLFCIWMSSGISQMKPYEPTLSLCPSVPHHPALYVSSSETKTVWGHSPYSLPLLSPLLCVCPRLDPLLSISTPNALSKDLASPLLPVILHCPCVYFISNATEH